MNDGIGPPGNHLRWSLPKELSFPIEGFYIFRKPSTWKLTKAVEIPRANFADDAPSEFQVGGIEFFRNTTFQVELWFPEPLAGLQLIFDSESPVRLRAYKKRQLLADLTSTSATPTISCASITRLVVDIESPLRLVEYVTDYEIIHDDNWQALKHVRPPTNIDEAWGLFEDGVYNHYLSSGSDPRDRYEPSANEIVEWFKRMFAPGSDRDWQALFTDWTQPANLLELIKREPNRVSVSANLQSIFLLAALDPNMARLLGLYYVDRFGVAPNDTLKPAEPKKFYDYKIYGYWDRRLEHCGLLLNLGDPRGDKPSVAGPLIVQQVPGLHWRDPVPDELGDVEADLPLGRLGLTWPKPVWNGDPRTDAVKPVLYQSTRKVDGIEENSELILVGAESWKNNKPCCVDANLKLGKYQYAIRPIDLFGQTGMAIESEPFQLRDFEAPPPPVRVRAQPSSDNASLGVQFEYGATQHQQARDVKEFSLYWREDSLLKRRVVEVFEVRHFPHEGQTINKLRLRNADETSIQQSVLEAFVGDVLTNVPSKAKHPLPAIDRRRYRIAQVDSQGLLITEKSTTAMSRGTYELISDPHNRSTWKKLSQTVAWREPIRSTLRSASGGLKAEVKKVLAPSVPAPNPFAQVPVGARGSQVPQLASPRSLVEVEIDRVLTEPDVFIDGSALINDQPAGIRIEYVVSNLPASAVGSGSSSYSTRIGLPPGTTINVGDDLKLLPADSFRDRVKQIVINGTVDQERLKNAGGEIAFGRQIDDRPVLTVMRVISNAVNANGSFDLLVRADTAADAAALPVNRRIRYYAPFVINVPMTLASSPTTGADNSVETISLPLQDSDGQRQGFVAMTSSDLRRNEDDPDARDNEGPLSTAAQFFVVRPKPLGTPSPPYPCGDKTATAGYASPPDRAGRATTCLKWDVGTLLPATGLRWEVVRALDASIPAAHLLEWQKGKKQVVAPAIEGDNTKGVVLTSSVDDKTGLITATFHPDDPVANPEVYRNGRLSILPYHFQVTLAQTSGADLKLLLRRVTNSPLLSLSATLHAPPDYSQVIGNHENLRALAANLPEAFALVTGVPIDPVITTDPNGVETVENRFRDDVPGRGRNAFFYRVRAVDAAENRSQWSQVSVPFHQADTTPPKAIRFEQPILGDRTVTLVWARPDDNALTQYRIFRNKGHNRQIPGSISDSPRHVVQIADIRPLPLRNVGGSVVLPNVPLRFSNSMSDEEIAAVLASTTVVRVADNGTNGGNLFDPKIGRIVFRRSTNSTPDATVLVTSISGLAITPPGSTLVVEIGNTLVTGNPSFSTWMDSGLVGGEKYSYSVMPVKEVDAFGNEGVPVKLTVTGTASEPVFVVGLDPSALIAPLFVSFGWVDAQGRPAVVSGEGLQVRLRISVTGASGIRIQKASGFNESWTNPLINGKRGWQTIEAGSREKDFFDETADPNHQWLYRIQARSADGRLSNFTDPLVVMPV